MPRTVLRTIAIPFLLLSAAATPAIGEGPVFHPVPRPESRDSGRTGETSGFWLGAGGVAFALAAFGAVSLAARRAKPGVDSTRLKIVGRASLSPRHAIHLVRIGDRTLIVGTGPQGAPALLGELDEVIVDASGPVAPARPDPPAAHKPHGATLVGSAVPPSPASPRRGGLA